MRPSLFAGLIGAVALATGGCGSDNLELRIAPVVGVAGGDVSVTLLAPGVEAFTESTSILEQSADGDWHPIDVLSLRPGGSAAQRIPPNGPVPLTLGVGVPEGSIQIFQLPPPLAPGAYRLVKTVVVGEGGNPVDVTAPFRIQRG